MKKTKRIISVLLVICMIAVMMTGIVYADDTEIIASGICGFEGKDNLTWELDGKGNLFITGSGDMNNYSWDRPEENPWNDFRSQIKTINISEGAINLGWYAFADFSNLESITIPASMTLPEGEALYHCDNLKTIIVDENNPIFDSRDNCNAIIETATNTLVLGCKNTVIPESVVEIGYCAFQNCIGLESITIPEGVTGISMHAFDCCSNLKSIVLPENTTFIRTEAFRNCNSLKSITIPESVTFIGKGAFYNCSSLENIDIPEGITNISYDTFRGCSSLKSITIPESVTDIKNYAFSGCSSLKSITIPEGVTSIDSWLFYGCSSLENITIPENVIDIGDYAFWGCRSLKSITIPESVTNIGNNAFIRCNDDLVIYGMPGSYAETYADQNGIKFKVYCPHENTTETAQKEPACTTCGYTAGVYCNDCGRHIEGRDEIPALGHDWGEGVITKDATCTEAGVKTFTCSRCKETKTEEIPATGHTEVVDAAKAPTCTETGLAEGIHCSVCGTVIKAQEEIPALGHTFKKGFCIRCIEKDPSYVDPAANGFIFAGGEWVYYQNGSATQLNTVVYGTVNGESALWKVTEGKADLKFTGLASNSDGWWYIENGKVNSDFTGFVDNEKGRWRIKDGKVNFGYNDIAYESGEWRYYYGGMFQKNYTGVTDCANKNGWWYVKNGVVDFTANIIASNKNGWWYVKNGKVDFGYTGNADNSKGRWKIKNGKVSSGYNNIVYENGQWKYYYCDIFQKDYTGVTNCGNKSGWWYVKNGMVDFSYTGFADNMNGRWRIEGGKVNFGYNNIVYERGQWRYYYGGMFQKDYTGVTNCANKNGWWYVKNGVVDFTANTVANNKNGWWYVKNGKVDFGYTGFADNSSGRWRMENGKVNFGYNDIVYENGEWRYYYGGMFQKNYTGVTDCANKNGWWYVKNGVVDFSYTGTAGNKNGTWYVKNGKVVSFVNNNNSNETKTVSEETQTHTHSFCQSVVLKSPSCLGNGEIKHICVDCGYSYIETIPTTGSHEWEEWYTKVLCNGDCNGAGHIDARYITIHHDAHEEEKWEMHTVCDCGFDYSAAFADMSVEERNHAAHEHRKQCGHGGWATKYVLVEVKYVEAYDEQVQTRPAYDKILTGYYCIRCGEHITTDGERVTLPLASSN